MRGVQTTCPLSGEAPARSGAASAPAVVSAALDGAASWDGEIPGRDRVRIIVAGAPPPTRTIERVMEELGWEFCQIYGLTETYGPAAVCAKHEDWDTMTIEAANRTAVERLIAAHPRLVASPQRSQRLQRDAARFAPKGAPDTAPRDA